MVQRGPVKVVWIWIEEHDKVLSFGEDMTLTDYHSCYISIIIDSTIYTVTDGTVKTIFFAFVSK